MDLRKLSDKNLITSLKECVKNEKLIIARVIAHLGEVEIRKLYSDFNYSSLFDYCIHSLGYSEDQAYRRIDALRTSKKNPLIKEKLNKGELTLTNVNLFSSLEKTTDLNSKQKAKIIESISNTSKKECEKILSKYQQKRQNFPSSKVQISSDTLSKIQKVQGDKGVSLEVAIELMYQAYLKVEKEKLIQKRKGKTVGSKRYIPKAVKIMAVKRSRGQCENCKSKTNLQFDHIKPYAKGGGSSLDNIRVLCRNCNLREGIKVFGVNKMNRASAGRGS